MHAEILEFIPTSGAFEEVDFSTNDNHLLWIRFDDDNGSSWCGKFPLGFKANHSKIAHFAGNQFFVLSGGQGFFLDAKNRKIINRTESESIEDFLIYSGEVVCNDGLHILIPSTEAPTWRSKRFSYDGIQFKSCEAGKIFGSFNDLSDEGSSFTFDVKSRALNCDHSIDFDR